MLINLRNAMMTGKKSPLPPGARWVEYLESTGTQWIDTKCPITLDVVFKVLCQSALNSQDNTIFSAYASTNPDYSGYSLISRIQRYRTEEISFNSFGARGVIVDSTNAVKLELSRTYYEVDGVRTTFTPTVQTLPPYQLGTSLFAIHSTPTRIVSYASDVKIFSFQQVNNGTILRDFHPIAIGTTGYLLDLVSGEYLPYGNKGTGNFVIGPEIPSPV